MPSFYFSELNKLKNAQKQFERYQSTAIDQISKIQNSETQQIIQYFQTSRLASNEENYKLEIQGISDTLKYMQRVVILEDGKNVTDLESLQEDLINVMNRIQDLKVHSKERIEVLSTLETPLYEEIKIYSERLCSWSEPIKLDLHRNDVLWKTDTSNNNLPDDVKKFMAFVKKNGHEGGWTLSDHHLFLKLRKKFPDLDELFVKLHEILPDITQNELKKHEDWFKEYLDLKEKNNEAIKIWKKQKKGVESATTIIVDQNENLVYCQKKTGKINKPIEKTNKDRKKIQDEIENWKKEREKLKTTKETLKVKEIEELKLKDKEKEHQNKLRKEILKKWKDEKLALEEDMKRKEEVKNLMEHQVRTSVANKMIKYYQMRDKAISNKHVEHIQKNNLPEKPTRSSQVKRDPTRLYKPTQQWIHRFLATNEKDPRTPVNFIATVPKLRTPSWRQHS